MTRSSLFSVSLALLLLSLSSACVSDDGREEQIYAGYGDEGDSGDEESESQPEQPPEELAAMFDAAAEEFDVPSIILSSIARVETSWQMVQGSVEFDGQPVATGIMALRGANLQEGAALAGVSLSEASIDPLANIRAGAAFLSALADELDVTNRDDVGAWAPVLAEYSGIEDQEGRDAYVYDEVFPLASGPIPLGPADEPVVIDNGGATPEQALAAGPDYAKSVWRPSPNYSSRPSGSAGTPSMVIIHSCEGTYSGCWSWLKNANSGVSAHYVVSNTGSEITQLVEESRKAWHIGAKYECSLNDNVDCGKDGSSSNNFTIGIEHAGYASQSSWDGDQIDASAELVCDITEDRNIPRDSYHIVGHGQLQPYNRVDPGKNWPWQEYIALIQDYCGDGPEPEPQPEPDPQPDPDPAPDPAPEPEPDPVPAPNVDIIIDSNDSLNGSEASMFVSAAWVSASGPNDWQTGYWWHSTQAVSDAAEFAFYLDAPAQLTVEAWWTEGTNRSSSAPYLIYDAANQQLASVYVDQTQAGGQWNVLGTYQFQAGWNFVDLSVWAPAGKVVIADAVHVHTP